MRVVVSDLHLGDGGVREDFLLWGNHPRGPGSPQDRARAVEALDGVFADFLVLHMLESRTLGQRPELLFNGDTFDLLQARKPRESNAGALERILLAHIQWTAALRNWIGGGGGVTFVLGNHDQGLMEPEAWALLAEVFPGINANAEGGPTHWYADAVSGLYAEHGHRWDPFNRVRNPQMPDSRSVGAFLVRRVINPLEDRLPWIDKGRGVADALRFAEAELGAEGLRRLFELAEPGLRRAPWLARVLAPWRKGEPADTKALLEREIRVQAKGLRQAMKFAPNGLMGAPAVATRFLASGHTHRDPSTNKQQSDNPFNPLNVPIDGRFLLTQPLGPLDSSSLLKYSIRCLGMGKGWGFWPAFMARLTSLQSPETTS